MSLTSPSFLAFLAITVIAFHATGSVRLRRLVLGCANLVFIGSYLTDVTQAMPLLGFLALGYAGLEAARRGRNGPALAIAAAIVLVVYVFLKRFSFVEPIARLPFPYLIIGLSYILFRVLHLMVDAQSGDLPGRVGPLAYFRYTCNFLCFVSGPIQRYQAFEKMDGTSVVALDADQVYAAFSRVVAGYVKFIVIAATANYVYYNVDLQLVAIGPIGLVKASLLYAICATAYTAYLYYNFSGYMDIVIGIGLLLGQRLPENFNAPFTARSFLEFWQRWHITLSEWFKLYLFNPLIMVLMNRFHSPALTPYLGVVAFFITFLVMGIWHGTTVVFVIYGLLMGAGASANKLWQVACVNYLGKKRYRAVTQTTSYSYLARGLTFAYFALALTCLWTPLLTELLTLLGRLGFAGVLGALIVLTVGFAAATLLLDAATSLVARRIARPAAPGGLVFRNLSLATRILAVLAIASLFNKAPEFVYKAF